MEEWAKGDGTVNLAEEWGSARGTVNSMEGWGREAGIVTSQVGWGREPGIQTFLEVWGNGAGTVDLQVEWVRERFGILQWPASQVRNKNVIEKILHEKKIATNHDVPIFYLIIIYVRKMFSTLFY